MIIKRKVSLSEFCFLMFWFFLQLGKGLGYTSKNGEYFVLLALGIPFAIGRLLLLKWDTNTLLKSVLLILLGICITLSTQTTTYLLSIVCIIAVRGMDIQKPLKMVLAVRGPLYVVRTTLAIMGFLDMEVSYRYEQGVATVTRYALGYDHPNTTQYELFMLIMVFVYLYQERLKIYHFIVAFLYNYLIFQYTDSKTAYYLLYLFMAAVLVCYKLNDRIVRRIATIIAKHSWTLGAFITIGGCLAYIYWPVFRTFGTFASRFLTATTIIQNESIALFGKKEMVTDLGYVYLLYSGGIVLFALFVLGINKLLKTRIFAADTVLLIIFACYSIFNIMECYTYSVVSNCMLLYLSAVVYQKRQRVKTVNQLV